MLPSYALTDEVTKGFKQAMYTAILVYEDVVIVTKYIILNSLSKVAFVLVRLQIFVVLLTNHCSCLYETNSAEISIFRI